LRRSNIELLVELFKSVGIVARLDRRDALRMAEKMSEYLLSKGLAVVLESNLASILRGEADSATLSRMMTDFIVVIGGDGTILKTCLLIPRPETPILSINMGRRGFLAEVSPKNAISSVDRCIVGDYVLEKCLKLSPSIGGQALPDALNEVLMTSSYRSKVLGFEVFKDHASILRCYSDGVMVSTPTGSTAHSLSAGGPVLDPDTEAFALTPICPLTPARPIVLPSDSVIQVEPIKPKLHVQVFVDGQYQTKIGKKDTLTIKRSDHYASFIRFGQDFYARLKNRLLFTVGR